MLFADECTPNAGVLNESAPTVLKAFCAALRQAAPATRSVPTEQNPDNSDALMNPTNAQASPTLQIF